jgi:hypothetical protein
MRCFSERLFLTLLTGTLLISAGLEAKDKKVKTPPKEPEDAIEVVGHIPLTNGSVMRFLTTQHYSSYYLYAERAAGNGVTLVDVTKPARPSVLGDVAYAPNGGAGSLFAVAGTAALVADGQATSPTLAPQTIRIMDFSDPLHPKVDHEFTGVTAVTRDERRGLIFLANAEGIWILHQNLAQDPEVEKAYAHHVIYDH